jgi:hypothetical protein
MESLYSRLVPLALTTFVDGQNSRCRETIEDVPSTIKKTDETDFANAKRLSELDLDDSIGLLNSF